MFDELREKPLNCVKGQRSILTLSQTQHNYDLIQLYQDVISKHEVENRVRFKVLRIMRIIEGQRRRFPTNKSAAEDFDNISADVS